MKLKICGIILLIIATGLIFSGSSIQFLDTFKEDLYEMTKLEKNIDESYAKITEEMKDMHQSMMEMNNFFSLYYENIGENKEYYQDRFQKIKSQKEGIKKQVEKTEISCKETVNNISKEKCKSLKINNQKAQESYQNLEDSYEAFIEGHTEWLEKNKTVAMN